MPSVAILEDMTMTDLRYIYKTRDFFFSKPLVMVQFLNVLFQEVDEVKKALSHPALLLSSLYVCVRESTE